MPDASRPIVGQDLEYARPDDECAREADEPGVLSDVMDCLPAPRRATSALEVAIRLYKNPALVSHRVRCGKPNCRCAAGAGHGPYFFLMWRDGRVQRRRYVRQADVAAVRAVVEYRRADDRAVRWAAALSLAELRRLQAWLRELEAD